MPQATNARAEKEQRTQDGASSSGAPVEAPWSVDSDRVAESLGVEVGQGLDQEGVRRRREEHGENLLREPRRPASWRILANQFESVVVWILAVAAVVSLVFARWLESAAIGLVVVVNTAIGFFTEIRAVRSMEALRDLSRTGARVRRTGEERQVDATELVPGDIVLIESGDVVTADLRLVEASKLQSNESALTGESTPVSKGTEPCDAEAPLAERSSMLFKGTSVTRGSGVGVVVSTGMETELGRIASLTEESEEGRTPLEDRLMRLGRRLIWVTLVVAAATIGIGIVRGKPPLLMAETGIALAVAAIPEGLPIVATLALAQGMRRMARRNALVDRLSAVETLGATGVILTDKTGTLTENQMTVSRLTLAGGEVEIEGRGLDMEGAFRRDGEDFDPSEDGPVRRALEIGVLCNNASLRARSDDGKDHEEDEDEEENGTLGDPMEVALLVAGAKAGLERDELLEESPEEREVAFDPETRAMATYHRDGDGLRVAVKGSPEAVLEACTRVLTEGGEEEELGDEEAERWQRESDGLTEEGLRVLALAEKRAESTNEEPYEGLTLVGLAGMFDPPREEVRDSLDRCRSAGVRVVMVTGDQPGTASTIARDLGMLEGDEDGSVVEGRQLESDEAGDDELRRAAVFARMAPEHKLRLIELHQSGGSVVAMTGDGVNDAPALKRADIGVAMGRRGAEAAKQAADMVLRDDNFGTIVVAVEQGRAIFANIRKAAVFMLCTNVAEVLAVGVATLVGWTLPLRPLQILYLNVLTDVLPALALSVGPGTGREMSVPPRDPSESILRRRDWTMILCWATVMGACVLGSLLAAIHWLGLSEGQAVTVSFLTLGFSKLWFPLNLRDPASGLLRNAITANRWLWGAVALCAGLLVGAAHLPGLADALGAESPTLRGWALVLCVSLLPMVLGQVWLVFTSARSESGQTAAGRD